MTPAETLQHHQQLCDELYQLAVEENRFLKHNQRVPDAPLLERKRQLLERMEQSLSALRTLNISLAEDRSRNEGAASGLDRSAVEKARAKVMQILHIDRENEQLLFRYSLSTGAKPPGAQPPQSQIQRLYGRGP